MEARARVSGGLLLAVALAAAGGCARSPTEQALRERIGAMQAAVERREVSAFIEGVDEDFVGVGGMDRDSLRNLVRIHVLRNARIGATTGPLSVQVEGEVATVDFDAVLTGSQGTLIPERAQAYRIRTHWRFEDGDWRVVVADWEPVL
ncbi:MAG TPA: nuclear transport factor 2 family protein [Xanthomonadaceae bacterium]|nr:nuclear transport factor 2 family protein [Xanthomonadaceae bacterium]